MKTYHIVTGTLFALVALVHLVRAVNHWPLVVGPWEISLSLSWVAVIITGILSIWSFRLIR